MHRTASALVRESQHQTKHIKGVRNQERAAMDEKLQRKLEMAKRKNAQQVCKSGYRKIH